MQRPAVAVLMPLLLILLTASAIDLAQAYVAPGAGDIAETFHFSVNITKSASHAPTYLTPFNRPGNFAINYSKTPKQMQGVTPLLRRPNDLELDVRLPIAPIRLDPRTCPNDLAYCYQVLEHEQNRSTFGKNYTAVSSYLLPELRVRTYVCIGNDTACVRQSTNCFCPEEIVAPPPQMLLGRSACTQRENLCMNSYGTFTLCEGNFSSCMDKYSSCGCGPYAACPSQKHTCVNTRHQLLLCEGALADCIKEYGTCFCGPEMSLFQQGCTTWTHTCYDGEKNSTCMGTFANCAVRHERCEC